MFLFKFVLFDVTGLFIGDWELELPYCGCHNRDVGTSSGVSFIISLLKQVSFEPLVMYQCNLAFRIPSANWYQSGL